MVAGRNGTERTWWDQDTKDLAYQLWWMRCGQNAAAVCRALEEGTYGQPGDEARDPIRVSLSTLTYWVRTEQWHRRAAEDRRGLAGGLDERVMVSAGFGFADGVAWLRAVADGTEPVSRSRDRIDAVRFLGNILGWDGADRRHAGQRPGLAAGRSVSVDYGSLTDAELLALERGQLPASATSSSMEDDPSSDDPNIVDI